MRIATKFLTIAGLIAMAFATVPVQAQAPAADGLIRTRQQVFAIPFHIDQVRSAADLPQEVRLHVSEDRGQNWRLESRWRKDNKQDVRTRHFTFRAPRDGEFWFKVQTINNQGQEQPSAKQSDLRVLVDTTQPSLTLNVNSDGPHIEAKWYFQDPNIDPTTFRIQYQVASGGQPVPVPYSGIKVPPTDPTQPDRRTGSARWNSAVTGTGTVEVLAMVSDSCGNRAIVKQVVQIANGPAAPQIASRSADTPPRSGVPNAGHPAPPYFGEPNRNATPHLADGSARWPAGETAQRPLFSPNRNVGSGAPPLIANGAPRVGGQAQRSPAPSGTRATPVAKSYDPPTHSPAPPATTPTEGTPTAGLSHYVNSNVFSLDYEVDTSDAPGIARVELWGTRDGGRSWQLFTTDTDRRSPVNVTVDADGHYGFQIIIDDVNGRGDPRPRSGDQPQMAVTVDRQAPDVHLIGAEATMNQPPGQMVIRWQARDQRLADRPVSLHYSNRPDGEWFVIASQLENNGQYIWQLHERLPEEIYLRLGVRDAAGNEGKVVTANPVILQRARPRGTLRGVRPAAPSASTPPSSAGPRATQAYTPPIN